MYSSLAGGAALEGPDDRNGFYTAALLHHLPVPGRRLVDTMMEVSKDVQQSTGQRQKPVEVRAGLTQKVVLVTPEMVVEEVLSLIPEARAELTLSKEEDTELQSRRQNGWASLVEDFVVRQEIKLNGRSIPLPLMNGSTEATRQEVRRLLLSPDRAQQRASTLGADSSQPSELEPESGLDNKLEEADPPDDEMAALAPSEGAPSTAAAALPPAGWELRPSTKYPGRHFYFNVATQSAQWALPAQPLQPHPKVQPNGSGTAQGGCCTRACWMA